ncbi:MAG: transcriptional repressor [Opitutaceae bacterium]|nr:transcriptional repressor [Opitutaceae bacterium]NBX59625.1 transcriptional repressor [Opitutaceae bacterium]
MSTPSENSATLAKRLIDSGLRPTAQREVVFKVILEKRDHPTADEIFARVKSQMPTISLATVYNCLETLVQCQLIRQVNLERAPTRYCPNLHQHAHFHDETTGQIHDIDLPIELMTQLHDVLPAGFNASSIELTFRGDAAGTAQPTVTADCAPTLTSPHGTN